MLTTPGRPNHVTEGAPRIHRGDTVTIGSMVACLDAPGSVTVTGIRPVHGTGLRVTGFAIRPNPFWKAPPVQPPVGGQIGVERMTLAELLFPTARTIDVQCGKHGEAYEFAVQVLKTTNGEAGASGWVATYESGGTTEQLRFYLAVRLCNEDKAWSRTCEALKV